MSIFVRFFALTDDSPVGDLAFRYTSLLVESRVPFRLVTTMAMYAQDNEGGGIVNRWGRFRDHLITPIPAQFHNVVCSSPQDWARYRTTVAGCIGNTLVTSADPVSIKLIVAAMYYDVLAVPTPERQARWLGAMVEGKRMLPGSSNWPDVRCIALPDWIS